LGQKNQKGIRLDDGGTTANVFSQVILRSPTSSPLDILLLYRRGIIVAINHDAGGSFSVFAQYYYSTNNPIQSLNKKEWAEQPGLPFCCCSDEVSHCGVVNCRTMFPGMSLLLTTLFFFIINHNWIMFGTRGGPKGCRPRRDLKVCPMHISIGRAVLKVGQGSYDKMKKQKTNAIRICMRNKKHDSKKSNKRKPHSSNCTKRKFCKSSNMKRKSGVMIDYKTTVDATAAEEYGDDFFGINVLEEPSSSADSKMNYQIIIK
jgi:hypothetical protein